jgi:protein ImuB
MKPQTPVQARLPVVAALFLPWPVWLLREEAKELPLAVHRGGRVVAVSPLARKLGARPGMALEAAQARVASLLALPYPSQAEAAWRSLLRELHALTPWVEPQGAGIAFLRLTPEEARLLAQGYGARVGVAPWREVALLAAWAAREGEARVVAEGEEGGFLDRLPLHLLRGVGLTPEGLARLRLLGLGRVGELRAWKPHQVAAYLPEGRALLPFLHGPWRREVAPFPEEAALEAHLSLHPPAEASLGLLAHLAGRLARGLAGRAASRVEVEAVGQGLRFRGEHLAKVPIGDEGGMRLALELALRKSGALGLPLEEVRARALGLFRPSRQEGLWRRAGEGLEAVVARFPGVFFRVEVVDLEALAPEWGFRLVPWEVEGAALPLAGGSGVPGRKAPLGALSR